MAENDGRQNGKSAKQPLVVQSDTAMRGAWTHVDALANFLDARLALRIAGAIGMPCVVALLRCQPGTAGYDGALGVGVALVCLTTAAVVTKCLSAALEPPVDSSNALATEATSAPARAIEPEDRARWAEASYDALLAACARDSFLPKPEIASVISGERGVEVLLHAPCLDAPSIFDVSAGGVLWALHPSVGLDDLIALDGSVIEHGPRLTLIGSDEESDFFTTTLDIPKYRLTEVDGGAPRYEAVHPIGDDQGDAPRSFGASLVLIEDDDTVLVEPLGLVLERVSENALSQKPFVETTLEEPVCDPVAVSGLAEARTDEDIELRSTPDELVPRGIIEVRILRERPDLVGALREVPTPAAVEFVAYLATHNHRATSARLRESLGTARARESSADRMTWKSAASARRSLGAEYVPVARGHQIYRLADSVTCDWTRFRALCDLAKEEGADPLTRRGALSAALSLVDGIPGLGSRRFSWLDVDGTLDQIATAVLNAARELARHGQASGSPELVAWAVAKGRLFGPDDRELLELKATLPNDGSPKGERRSL